MIDCFLDNLWRWKCGMSEKDLSIGKGRTLEEIYNSQWSLDFEALMRHRLTMGYFRYGPLGKQKGKYNNVQSIIDRAKLYQKTGNDEILVDIANLALCEFRTGVHPNKHFKASDDNIHTKEN
jgi:hypothetical protein